MIRVLLPRRTVALLIVFAAGAVLLFACVGTGHASLDGRTRVDQLARDLAARYNRVNAHAGPQSGMASVLSKATSDLADVGTTDRRDLARILLVWSSEMRLANPRLQSSFVSYLDSPLKPSAAFAGPVPWRRVEAISQLNSYLWSGEIARNTECHGRFDRGAWFDAGARTWYFTTFKCEFSLNGVGRPTFEMHVLDSRSAFRTDQWRGLPASSSSGSTSGGGCMSGTARLQLEGVDCQTAIAVYDAYEHSGAPPEGWSCSPSECDGPPDFTGLPVSFTW